MKRRIAIKVMNDKISSINQTRIEAVEKFLIFLFSAVQSIIIFAIIFTGKIRFNNKRPAY